MKETMMIVTDLLDHHPGQSLIEILYLSTKMPYESITKNLRREGLEILILPDAEVERMAKARLRRGNETSKPSTEVPKEEIRRECTPAFLEFLNCLENCAKEDKRREEEAAIKAADEHAKKVEAAKRELAKAAGEEEEAMIAYKRSCINKQIKLEAYLDLLDERRNYQ